MIVNVLVNLFIFFNMFFLLGIFKKDYSLIDIGWGLSFLTLYLSCFFVNTNSNSIRVIIIGLLVFIWSLRLSGYLLFRSIKKGEEDYRYTNWRKEWGEKANFIAYFKVYMLQMVLSLIIASPLFLIFQYSDVVKFGNFFDILGLIIWFVGFSLEVIADHQKHKFKNNPANAKKFCKKGLWRYSRHPNYFGEVLLWWGVFLMVINIVPFYYALWGPLILHILIIKVSGVAMLEESYKEREGFLDYKNKTSRFLPFPPLKRQK